MILFGVAWAALTAMGLALALKVRGRNGLAAVCVLGIAVRAVIYFALGPIPYQPGSDPFSYANIAANVLSGNGILVDHWRALYPPLYPLLIAIPGPTFVNIAADIGTALTIYILGAELGEHHGGKIAATLYLLWPASVLSVTTPQKEGLMILLGAQIALAALRLGREWKWQEAVRLGVCAGLMGLTQPAFAPFAGVAALVMAPRQAVRSAAWSVPIAVLVMLPWWIRNWLVFQAFVPFTTAFGYNMVVAVTGYYTPLRLFTRLPELAGSKAAAHAALQVWAERPWHVLYIRTAAAFKAAVFERWFTDSLYWVASLRDMRPIFMSALQAYWLAIVAAAALSIRKAPRELLWLIVACLIQFALFNFWFEFGERHRYLVVPFVMLLAATPKK